MGNCLKTQLKETVNNDNLLKVGEAVLHVTTTNNPNVTSQQLSIAGDFSYLEIVGNGYFISANPGDGHWDDGTNKYTTDDPNGKKVTTSVYGSNTFYVSNGDYIIKFYSKYSGGWRTFETGLSVSYDIEDMKYKKVNIIRNRGKKSTGEILPVLLAREATDALVFDFRSSSLSFSMKDFLYSGIVCDVDQLWVQGSSIKDQDAATVAAIKEKYSGINIDINPSA